ncbi:MAG: DUF1080 domain-containing protein [Bacteroidota bacterium]
MKISLLAAGLALLTPNSSKPPANTNATDSSATAAMPGANSSGWVSLFDGTTTAGWHSYGKTFADATWKVNDGALMVDNSVKNGADLVSDGVYDNFDLKLEWKISPKGNSGILFYIQDEPAKYNETYKSGPEMQVLDNDGHPDGKIPKHRAGDLYDLIKSSSEPVKPVGEWNQAEIIANKGKLELKLNGVTVVSTILWNNDWKKLVAGSKFKDMPDWGTFTSGHIALQDHGNTVWYRKIQIKKL